MKLSEKRVPQYLRLAAIAGALALTGWLWAVGRDNPRRYTLTMTYNHHAGYGAANVSCNECHVPQGDGVLAAIRTTIACSTMKCHPELEQGLGEEERRELAARAMWPLQGEEADAMGRRYLLQHDRAASLAMDCMACHTEHTPMTVKPRRPDWWDTLPNAESHVRASVYTSLVSR
jgi:hypothetical protein